jgi:hypothetical protein
MVSCIWVSHYVVSISASVLFVVGGFVALDDSLLAVV